MTVRKHKQRNSWYASFYYTDWRGIRSRKKKEGFATKKEALEFERSFLDKEAQLCNLNFSVFVEIYFEYCRKHFKESTCAMKSGIMKTHILPYFGHFSVGSIKPADIRRWHEELLSKNLSKSYLSCIDGQMAAVLKFAVMYFDAPIQAASYKKIGGQPSEMKFWTLEQFREFIAVVEPDSEQYIIFQILFWTGIRRGEMMALCPQSFDFEKKTMRIEKNIVLIKGRSHTTTPKTNSSVRTIELPDFLIQIIKQHIDKNKIKGHELMFKINAIKLWRILRRICQKMNIAPIRLHDLRHSHASMLMEFGFSFAVIAKQLGHKNIATTMRTYAHLYPGKQKILAAKLDEIAEK